MQVDKRVAVVTDALVSTFRVLEDKGVDERHNKENDQNKHINRIVEAKQDPNNTVHHCRPSEDFREKQETDRIQEAEDGCCGSESIHALIHVWAEPYDESHHDTIDGQENDGLRFWSVLTGSGDDAFGLGVEVYDGEKVIGVRGVVNVKETQLPA